MAANNLVSRKPDSYVRSRVTAENPAAEPTEMSNVTELKTVPVNSISTESGNELSAEICWIPQRRTSLVITYSDLESLVRRFSRNDTN